MENATKSSSSRPGRNREWERQRRNKFNDAIAKLGDIVKAINRANDPNSKESDNAQCAKIEIIQKAIICLTDCDQQKVQLKAEILALQVKLDQRSKTQDASTQVRYIHINRKVRGKSKNQVKVLINKSRETTPKTEHSILKPKAVPNTISPKKLPALMPKRDVKSAENTFVVLPAAPYIFPQRPILFPSAPPAIVLVDNLQAFNKQTAPRNRNCDVTKTTMVNILPISAYSVPTPNIKNKKPVRKSNVTKSVLKKTKDSKLVKESLNMKVTNNDKLLEDKEKTDNITCSKESSKPQLGLESKSLSVNSEVVEEKQCNNSTLIDKVNNSKTEIKSNVQNVNQKINEDISKVIEPSYSTVPDTVQKKNENKATEITTLTNVIKADLNKKEMKKSAKESQVDDKVKENKLPTLLDSALCENAVDGGNARLELAEEFLAASPTAAFLMSFPLVSGNRADSPNEEVNTTIVPVTSKENGPRRNENSIQQSHYFEKSANNDKLKTQTNKIEPILSLTTQSNQQKYTDTMVNKQIGIKSSNAPISLPNVSNENPFLGLPMPSLISTSCPMTESSFALDFDCNLTKSISNPTSGYVSSSNLFYKGDPFGTVKNSIYSTSSISSGHEYGLYPCAVEKYTSKNKSDYSHVDENFMKMGSSRLTYDIDLGWSHKGFDFVNCTTTSNTHSKDTVLTTPTVPYSSSYNPFNSEFHVPLVSTSNKKDTILSTHKPISSFSESITSLYSQPSNLWTEDTPFYSNNMAKSIANKHQNYLPIDHFQSNAKPTTSKHYDPKHGSSDNVVGNELKLRNSAQTERIEKFTKKSPSKMHINWMTSETRPNQSNFNLTHTELKDNAKQNSGLIDVVPKKQDHNEGNYFSFPMHNFSTQPALEELQVWPVAKPGTTEITIEPPPINLPTLVGDLALGPHDRKKNAEIASRGMPQSDLQNCSTFLSVTQLMNRSSENMSARYPAPNLETTKTMSTKQLQQVGNEINRKPMISRLDTNLAQPCYIFNDPKITNSYENMPQYSQTKSKNKVDKISKTQKNSYSAEALIRGGACNQKIQDSTKFMSATSQKYTDFSASQNNSIAQVTHFPPIIDYSDNNYANQQFSGTTLYNTTTNTISNSFYSNFMPTSSNLMPSNYSSGPFSSDYIDYNQTTECNYTNNKYEELKARHNSAVFQQEKVPPNYKASRRDSTAKHKLDCTKKESSKKYQSKRTKLSNDAEEWSESAHMLWQNKSASKKHPNMSHDETIPFPNYVGNQMAGQFQPEFYNNHLMPANVQGMGNTDRALSNFPVTSRANFNLSTIFPEITMKVQ